MPHSLALLLEMLVGLLLLLSFRALWERYYAAVTEYSGGKRTKKRLAVLLGYGVLWGGAAIAFGLFTIIVAILLSGWLLAQAIWLNVGPLLAVVFFKAKHAAESSKESMEKARATAAKSAEIAARVSGAPMMTPPDEAKPRRPAAEKAIDFWRAAWAFKGLVLMLFVSLFLVLVGKGH